MREIVVCFCSSQVGLQEYANDVSLIIVSLLTLVYYRFSFTSGVHGSLPKSYNQCSLSGCFLWIVVCK